MRPLFTCLFVLAACHPAHSAAVLAGDLTATPLGPATAFREIDLEQADRLRLKEALGCICSRPGDEPSSWLLHAFFESRRQGYKLRLASFEDLETCVAAKAQHPDACVAPQTR